MSEEEVQGKHLGAKVPLQHARQGSVRSGWIVTTSDSYFFLSTTEKTRRTFGQILFVVLKNPMMDEIWFSGFKNKSGKTINAFHAGFLRQSPGITHWLSNTEPQTERAQSVHRYWCDTRHLSGNRLEANVNSWRRRSDRPTETVSPRALRGTERDRPRTI